MRKLRISLTTPLILIFLLLYVPVSFAYESLGSTPSSTVKEVARYKATDGFEIISYSKTWNTSERLKDIYDELLNNYRGEEFKLLNRINIYPDQSPDGQDVAGHWFGTWKINKGKYELMPNRYINLYYGDAIKDVSGFARTISHEYGHHFTYYYYFKREKKPWSKWRTTEFARVRGIVQNPYIGSGNETAHAWQIEEIAANDYVQLFGSINAKKSQVFEDIAERAKSGNLEYTYSDYTFNLSPQENPLLSLASNVELTRDYWLGGVADQNRDSNAPPKAVILSLEESKDIGANERQYVFRWSESSDETSEGLEYTLVRYKFSPKEGDFRISPVKTVYHGSQLRAVYGAVLTGNTYFWDVIPKKVQFFNVYVKDSEGLTVASNSLVIDFSNSEDPDYVSLSVQDMDSGNYFRPRVKLDDKQLIFDVEPEIINKTTMVPFRTLFNELGAEVTWEGSTRTIYANKGDIRLSLMVGNSLAMINDEPFQLPVPVMIKNGSAIVPLRLISEVFGADVEWNPRLQLVTINSQGL